METTPSIISNVTDISNESSNDTILYPLSPIEPGIFKIYNIYLYMMIALGVIDNLIVLIVFLNNRPSTTTDWFILSITVCDFISSVINVPVYVTFTNGYWQKYGTTLICRLHMFLSQSIVLSSSFLICGLALDRYFKICRQLSSFTTARARNACLVITVITTVLSIPSFVMHENRAGRCVSIVMDITLFAYYLLVFLIFIFATIVVVFSYYKVTKTVVESAANIARHANTTGQDRQRKVPFFSLSYRNNRVLPSTSTMYRGKLFGDSSSARSSEQAPIPGKKNKTKDLIHVSPPVQMFQIQERRKTSVIFHSDEGGTNAGPKRSVFGNTGSLRRNSASLRTTKLSFIVCSIFILTWIPPWLCFVLASIPDIKNNTNVVKFMLFGRMTYLLNGFLNPVIYTLLNKRFRSRIFEIFCFCKTLKP